MLSAKISDNIRILMIDDDEEDFFIIREIIAEINHQKYSIDWVGSYEEGIERINAKKYDLYLVDYRLGPRTGDELIGEAVRNGCQEPLILLTGQNNIEADNKALLAGASDFLVKSSLTAHDLETSVRYSVTKANDLKEIKRLNENLEARVKERTSFLEKANAELLVTREKLELALEKEKELNDLKSRFVSMASHEFRTPLATILSSLSLIARYNELKDFEKQKKHIDRINSSVANLTEIINDVLSLSKLEEEGMDTTPEKLNIHELTNGIIKEMQPIAKPGQKINYQHDDISEVFTNKKALRHIIMNLLSNAIKFSQENKPIEINTKVRNNVLTISIKDSGIGISEEDQKHLFGRFFRGSNASAIQGTGLGLNIVAKYVELLGGNITCCSQLNEGTIFTMTLPYSKIN